MVTFSVLLVCTGNLCRSPAAELLLARALAGVPGYETASAGTGSPEGLGVHSLTAEALAARGVDPIGHVSRQLTPDLVEAADLVLTAARTHRPQVLALDPTAAPRTFTLLEFARLAPAGGAPDPAALVRAAAAARRGAGTPADDVPDPIGHGPAAHESAVATIEAAVLHLAPLLTPSPPPRPPRSPRPSRSP